MERLGDRRLAGMSYAQAGVHVSVCGWVCTWTYIRASLLYTRVSSVYITLGRMHVFTMFMCVCESESVRKSSNTFPRCARCLSPALTLAGSADRSQSQLPLWPCVCLLEDFLIHRVKTLSFGTLHPHGEELLVWEANMAAVRVTIFTDAAP